MTQIAQRIDDENRALMKKNAELKIEYLSQENDRDMLMKQLIFQKKESQRLKMQADILREQGLQAGIPRSVLDREEGLENNDIFANNGGAADRMGISGSKSAKVPNLNLPGRASMRL